MKKMGKATAAAAAVAGLCLLATAPAPSHAFYGPLLGSGAGAGLRLRSVEPPQPQLCPASLNHERSARTCLFGRRSEKIARTKGKEDMKRAKVFARIGKKIMMAVKAGGPNEDSNKALSDVLKEAKAYNVPKDNIVRVIKKATDGSEGDYKEAVYEVYAHGGVGLLITCLTDNTNRANVEIKTVCKKQDLQMAASGSVAFQFARKGRIEFKDGSAIEEDPVIEAALLADVDDVELVEGDEEGSKWALTEPTMLMALADALAASGMEGEPALVHVPNALVDVSDEDMEKNFLAIETLEALDDVDVVEHNMA